MTRESPEVTAARRFTHQAASLLERTPSFQQLPPTTQAAIVRDLGTIRQAFDTEVAKQQTNADPYALLLETPSRRSPSSARQASAPDPYALALETPNDLVRRRGLARQGNNDDRSEPAAAPNANDGSTPAPRAAATETLAPRAGALSDEIDFPAFVANLVQGTFDAIVDASIRQMEAFAGLVSAVAKDVDRFTSENVTPNQVRDWLAEQYPRDLMLDFAGGQPRLHRRPGAADEDSTPPVWLADYGLEGEEFTEELIEQQLVPAARRRYGENRLQMLATMVLLGMNRINVRDGSISARLRFRAAAKDKAAVDYAVSQDPGAPNWGSRGSGAYAASSMMVSTVGVNVQAESELKAELFGEVKINFVSETLPLERFADAAQMTLLQRNARAPAAQTETLRSALPTPTEPAVTPPTPTPSTGGT